MEKIKFKFEPKCKNLEELIMLMPKINEQGLIDDGILETHYCIFEEIYFKRPSCNCPNTNEFRKDLGSKLPPLPDYIPREKIVVVPVPDSGKAAARGYAQTYGYFYDSGFSKWTNRSFITPPDEREDAADWKYEANPDVLKGKVVVIIDDSIVRGTTIKRLIVQAFEAGAEEVYFMSSAPPLFFNCYCGIEMKKKTDFLARTGLPNNITYSEINLERVLENIHKEVFNECIDLINKNYKQKVYDEEHYKYMLSKINNAHIHIKYPKLDKLKEVANSFFINPKTNRFCYACLNGYLHILKGNDADEFDNKTELKK